MVRLINNKEQFDKLLAEEKDTLIVIDFFAVWCGPCKKIGPIFAEMSESEEYKDVIFAKIDVDDNEETTEHVGISVMPTFVFYKNSSKIDELTGSNEEALRNKLKFHMK